MKPKPALQLPATVLSVQDIESLIVEIKDYGKWLSHNSVKQKMNISGSTQQPDMTAAAQVLIAGAGADWEGLIADLQDLRDNAPRLTITLAAPAGGELKRTLAAWCRSNIEPDVLVSFQFNSTLLGGMVVRYGSHIFDWSFRRQILDKRSAFPAYLYKESVCCSITRLFSDWSKPTT
jgi:hypothetical protein